MKKRNILVPFATALVLACRVATAQTVQQSTSARNAPQTAIAISGHAAIEINTVRTSDPHAATRYSVSVQGPLTVVASPGTHVTLRVGGQR